MHWRNSNFQIKQFLAAKCHTADEAYRVLQELREDRDVAIRNAEASDLRTQAKRLAAENILNDESASEVDKLEAKADIVEIEAFADQSKAVLETALKERDYIDSLIEEVQQYRKFAHLSDDEAHQAAQEEEWRQELLWRAENFMASQGTIPHDHLATMRLHPAWEQNILPHIREIQTQFNNGQHMLEMHKDPLALENKTGNSEGSDT